MKYLPRFLLIQLIDWPLMGVGLFICLWPSLAKALWLWWNDENPPVGTWWQRYRWLALRNPTHNFGKLPGVFGKGLPLWYRTLTIKGKLFYAKAGWRSDGYICSSIGAGKGY